MNELLMAIGVGAVFYLFCRLIIFLAANDKKEKDENPFVKAKEKMDAEIDASDLLLIRFFMTQAERRTYKKQIRHLQKENKQLKEQLNERTTNNRNGNTSSN